MRKRLTASYLYHVAHIVRWPLETVQAAVVLERDPQIIMDPLNLALCWKLQWMELRGCGLSSRLLNQNSKLFELFYGC